MNCLTRFFIDLPENNVVLQLSIKHVCFFHFFLHFCHTFFFHFFFENKNNFSLVLVSENNHSKHKTIFQSILRAKHTRAIHHKMGITNYAISRHTAHIVHLTFACSHRSGGLKSRGSLRIR